MSVEKPKLSVINPEFKDKNVIQYMRDAAAEGKKSDVRSALIITVDSNDHVEHSYVCESEFHMALIALVMPDVKDDLKSDVFKEYLED